MSRVSTLIDTIIRLQRLSQMDVSEQSGVHPSNLSKFLNGDSDIRTSSFIEILGTLGIDVEGILQLEIDKALGRKSTDSVGDALETLLGETDIVSAKTILDSLSKRVGRTRNSETLAALKVIQEYKLKLKSERRHA